MNEQKQSAVAGPVEPTVRPSAWIDNSGHPHHLRYVQGVAERRLYGPLQPLYDQAALDAAVTAERERCARICDTTPPYPFRASIEAAHAIRNQKA